MWIAYSLLCIQICLIIFHKPVNMFLDDNQTPTTMKYLLLSLPLFAIIYADVMNSLFSFKNLGIPVSMNKKMNSVLSILGAYGVIQILAQDTGLKTGVIQRDTVQSGILFAFIALGMGYITSDNRSFSMIATLMYFHMKYVISDNKTLPVCFEDV